MSALRTFGGWIVPVAVTIVLALGHHHPIQSAEREEHEKAAKKLRKIHDILQKGYVEEVETAKLYDGAAQGMLTALDPHSQYFTAEEMKEFAIDTEGKYGGIGVQVEFTDEGLLIEASFEDTPAFKAGLVAGDRIMEIDGTTTQGMNATDAAKHIRGEPKTKVTLTVARKSTGKTEKMELMREEIRIPTVKGTAIVNEVSKIGYVRLLQFQEDSFEKLKKSIDELVAKGMRALIIDLRFNGGGLLREAEEIADLFLEEGVIVETKGRLEAACDKVIAKKDGTYPNFPIALLVNSGSASASEVVAGALQDHERAILVGGRTYGKGSVQQYLMEELGDGSGFKYTWARYYTPKGRWIDKKAGKEYGLEPDLLVEQEEGKLMEHWQKLDKSEKSDFKDEPLVRAIDALKVALRFSKK